jgi:hypothetical protein
MFARIPLSELVGTVGGAKVRFEDDGTTKDLVGVALEWPTGTRAGFMALAIPGSTLVLCSKMPSDRKIICPTLVLDEDPMMPTWGQEGII